MNCPCCGQPIKRHKLPNGFGQISKLTKKGLKKPYRAMIHLDKHTAVLLQPIAYFETYDDAYQALQEYHAKIKLAEEYPEIAKDLILRFTKWTKDIKLKDCKIKDVPEDLHTLYYDAYSIAVAYGQDTLFQNDEK